MRLSTYLYSKHVHVIPSGIASDFYAVGVTMVELINGGSNRLSSSKKLTTEPEKYLKKKQDVSVH